MDVSGIIVDARSFEWRVRERERAREFLNRGSGRDRRYAMLERAIRRTGCSFVFRYARSHPLLHPPRSAMRGCGAARARERGRLVADSDNYCRFVAGNPSSRRKQLFSIRGQRETARSLCPLKLSLPPSSFLSPANARPSPSFVPFLELSEPSHPLEARLFGRWRVLIIGIGSKGEDTRAIYLSTGVWRSKQKLAASERIWFTIEGVGSIEGGADSGGGTRIKGF